MSQQIVHQFKESIRAKMPLLFKYADKERHVCPYMLGKTKDDRLVVHAMSQTNAPGDCPWEWRFFYLDQVQTMPLYSKGLWHDASMKKTEGDPDLAVYVPPKFIVEVLALIES